MKAEALRDRLPRGTSKLRIVQLFQKGLSLEYIAGLIGCYPLVVEDVIREAIKKVSA